MTECKTYKLSEITVMRNGKKRPSSKGPYPVYGGNGIMDYADCFNAENTIIVGRVGAYCGNVYLCKSKCWVSDNAISVSANEYVDSRYLYYLMTLLDFHHHHIGGAQPLMTQDIIGGFEISLPPLEEQRRIAGILGAIDDKIECNRRINANLELQARALYKQWFVNNRSREWETLELDKVAKISAGGDKPCICSKQRTNGCRVPIFSNGIDNEGLYGYTNESRILEKSITVSARGTIGFVCLRTEPYVPIVRLISVVPTKENLSAEFLYLWAITQNISGTGTTQQQLTVPDFKRTSIVVPDTNLLCKFNEVIMPIFSKIKHNKEVCESLASLRDTLLPELMNGEIKVAE